MIKYNTKQFLKTLIYLQLLIFVMSIFFIQTDLVLAGAWMGKFAIYTFWLIALAGILQRFQVKGFLKKVQFNLLTNRRQLGILMFILSFMHYMWSKGLSIILNGIPTSIPLFQIFGLIALVLTIPLFVTSNNYSVKKLGLMWKLLHRLVYPIMFLLVLHTAMQGDDFNLFGLDFGIDYTLSYAIPSLFILILQIFSYIYKNNHKTNTKEVNQFLAKVTDIKDNTEFAKTLTLELVDENVKNFEFIAGQHVSLFLDIDSKKNKRSYSICNDVLQENSFNLSVKKVENGIVSNYINDNLEKGTVIPISKPFGEFFSSIDIEGTNEVVLWAAGSGITPIFAIIQHILKKYPSIKLKLFYANSNVSSVMFKAELEKLTNEHFELTHIISKGEIPVSKTNYVKYIKGRISTDLIKSLNFDSHRANHYICGPDAVIEICQNSLIHQGVSTKNIHVETFNRKKTGQLFASGQIVLESGEYVCIDCGYKEYYQAGELFKFCSVCLAGEDDPEYEFWQKI